MLVLYIGSYIHMLTYICLYYFAKLAMEVTDRVYFCGISDIKILSFARRLYLQLNVHARMKFAKVVSYILPESTDA